MRFTRLRLTGFKSFVDPTDLVIAEGLTGVVGPNGCGKSNLLEALRWVMGENRPTAMRGDGMEDVIFAGTARRAARGSAEVALQVDNTERLAPSGFNDADQIEVVRRITRDAGSAYRVNGREVRARDVQMLFADASTGAHSPALVRQGQISELINARPKARRRILEEAAGISGLYQRRHEAELKLNGAESNLARLEDVLEQMRAQLAALERQSRQAARYRELSEALGRAEGAILLSRHRAAAAEAAEAARALDEARRIAARAQGAVASVQAARLAAEEAMPPLREEAAIAGALRQRLAVAREALDGEEARAADAIRRLESAIAGLGRDATREAELDRDAGETITRLEEEAAALAAAHEGHDARLAAAAEAARSAAAALQGQEAALDRQSEDVARLSARHLSAQRQREEAASALARLEEAAARAMREGAAAEETLATASKAEADADAARLAAEVEATAAETALEAAEGARAAAQAREATARAERSEAEGEAAALRAEVSALARLVERETAEAPQVLDLVRVQEGHEAALGAALADDLRAPVAEGREASGWHVLPELGASPALPEGAEPLAPLIDAPRALARRLALIGLVPRGLGAALQHSLLPGQRLVSMEGDLWRWDGFVAAAEDAPSAAALRLRQINRLTSLRRSLEEANARADGAARAHAALALQMSEAAEADKASREARRKADEALARANRTLSRAQSERSLLEGRLESVRANARRLSEEGLAARARLDEAAGQEAALPPIDAARAQLDQLRADVEAARRAMMERRAAHDELRRAGEERARRLAAISREVASWQERRRAAGQRVAELEARARRAEADLSDARQVPPRLAAQRARLGEEITLAEARVSAAAEAQAEGEEALRAASAAERRAEGEAAEAREARARAEARAEAAEERAATAAQRIRDERDCSPAELAAALGSAAEAAADPVSLEAEIARLRQQREALGAVNLRAEEDAREVATELETLGREKAELEAAISKLRAGIASLNREGRERLLLAFDKVNGNFTTLFRHLFGGGEANLVMVESDDPLEAGLEIMCQPPGKKLSTLSLLSGGEQTLTALALIFAVFLANPAPICVLDEVDAPLDDANVGRFCDMLDEMVRRTETRFLIITHHAITMARMDRLFGVTMGELGVSQLVSVDLRRAEALVA